MGMTPSMNIEANESFIRWQSATRKHFTVTSNLVLGLSTGFAPTLHSLNHDVFYAVNS